MATAKVMTHISGCFDSVNQGLVKVCHCITSHFIKVEGWLHQIIHTASVRAACPNTFLQHLKQL